MKHTSETSTHCYYFVDEAGDGNLFNSKGHIIIGDPGCSRYFMLGILEVPNPTELAQSLADLRHKLLADPYFQNVPSMQPRAKKTNSLFHAKDDIPEVRREVFALLKTFPDLRFFAIVTDKFCVLDYVKGRNRVNSIYRYNTNELYDYLVRRLFRDRLHKSDSYDICIAKRGSSDRTEALENALYAARYRLFVKWGIDNHSPTQVIPLASKEHPCLQAADYYLWSLYRLYEKDEDRYLNYLWPSFRLVIDMDDHRVAEYGSYYTERKPLTRAALEWRK